MKYDPEKHHRRSIRLKGHDYAGGGVYFVTLCVHRDAGNLFADEAARAAVEACWQEIPKHFPHAEAKDFVVMPDHVHGIIRMAGAAVGAKKFSPVLLQNGERPRGTSRTLGSVVRGFKVGVSKWFRENRGGGGGGGERFFARTGPVWQRNYYEMIVRSAEAEEKIAGYIRMNPWKCVQSFGNGLRGIGNPALWNGKKLGVLCSRNAPHIGHIPDAEVYFGGWHSPKEKEIFEWLLKQGKRVIACPAWGIGGGTKDFSPVLGALEENRLLILEMRNRDGDLAAAEQRNRFVIKNADALFVPHTTPGGMLERLLKEKG
jgi:REP element-mobilizing transposase RayT